MQTAVELQDMLSYSLVGPMLIGILLCASVAVFIIRKLVRKMKAGQQAVEPKEVIKPKETPGISVSKDKYCKLLTKIEYKYNTGVINDRQGFAELSKTIRLFVHEVTGIRVQNYTLAEIGEVGMPKLYELISECYIPEFKEDGSGDILAAVSKAREVIMQWK